MSSSPTNLTEHQRVRVTPDDREQTRAAALVAGVKPSEFIRQAVADRARVVLANVPDDALVMGLVLTPEQRQRVDDIAAKRGCTRADVVRDLIAGV